MAYQCFLIRDTALGNIDQVIHDTILQAQKQIQVAEPCIRIDQYNAFAPHRQSHTKICCGRCLTDAALTRRNYDYLTHQYKSYLSIGSMIICPFLIDARSARADFST